MDPYGNLTTAAELAGGRRIRLISYLDPDVAIGCFDSSDGDGWPRLGVHRLSSGDPGRTIFQSGRLPHFTEGDFYLIWPDEAGCVVSMEGDSDGCLTCIPITGGDDGDPPNYPAFMVDFVNGCWFALNDPLGVQVVDVRESGTDEQTPVIAFRWNGGPNQIWRAQDVDFTPPASVSDEGAAQQAESAFEPAGTAQTAAD
jgi:hypothetical protein